QWLLARGADPARISVLPNGIDLEEYSPLPEPRRRFHAGSDSPFVAAFIGRLSGEKGADLFVDIVSRLAHRADIRFVIVGVGVMQQDLQARVVSQGLSDSVRFLGYLPIHEALTSCDAVIVCSRLDGRPNVIMES